MYAGAVGAVLDEVRATVREDAENFIVLRPVLREETVQGEIVLEEDLPLRIRGFAAP